MAVTPITKRMTTAIPKPTGVPFPVRLAVAGPGCVQMERNVILHRDTVATQEIVECDNEKKLLLFA